MKQKKLGELSKDELMALGFYLIRNAYNQHGPHDKYEKYSRLYTKHCDEKGIVGCMDFCVKNFSNEEEKLIFAIITGRKDFNDLIYCDIETMKKIC